MQGHPVVLLFISQISFILWKAACKDVDLWNKITFNNPVKWRSYEEGVKVITDISDFFQDRVQGEIQISFTNDVSTI